MTDTDPRTQAALTVSCPDCLAPAGRPCGDQFHADRLRIVDLRALTRGTCALCGQPMVRGSLDGAPDDAWHPDTFDAAQCPRMPDPGKDWQAYALAVNLGLTPGHPGAEHFRPLPVEDAAAITVHEVALPATDLQNVADALVEAGHAPDQATAPSSAPSAWPGSAPTVTAPPSTP